MIDRAGQEITNKTKNKIQKRARWGESGNVFFTLFGAVALVGVVGAATSSLMRGPVGTVMGLNAKAKADTQMNIAARLAVLETAQLTGGPTDPADTRANCDNDSFLEPLNPLAPTGADTAAGKHPNGGGFLPSQVGAQKIDPWGTKYGYCGWNHGLETTCRTGLLAGKATGEDGVAVALISAGPDRTFQSTCSPDPDYVEKGDSDDLVLEFTYSEAIANSDGLWKIMSGDPNTATIGDKNIQVAGSANIQSGLTVSGGGSFGGGAFNFDTATDFYIPTVDGTAGAVCSARGSLRVKNDGATAVLQLCDGSTWADVGGAGAIVSAHGPDGEIQYSKDGIMHSSPSLAWDDTTNTLEVAGDITSDNLQTGDINATTANVTGVADIGSLEVDGGAVIFGSASIGGPTNVDDNLSVSENLEISGDTELIGDLLVGGPATFASDVALSAGSANNPSIRYGSSGLFFPGSGGIGVSVGSSEVVRFTSSGMNVDGTLTTDDLQVNNGIAADSFEIDTISSGIGMFGHDTVGVAMKNAAGGVYLEDSGNVGIGISNPEAMLDVGGSIASGDYVKIGGSAFPCNGSISGALRYVSGDLLQVCSDQTGDWETIGTSGGGGGGSGSYWERDNDDIFYTDGSVMIGTNTEDPDVNLRVIGNIGADQYCSEDGDYCFTAADVGGGQLGAPGNDREVIFNSGGILGTSNDFVFSDAGWLALGGSTPQAELDVIGTGALITPRGNTAQRPGTPINGMIRYNHETAEFEGYSDDEWQPIGGETAITFVSLTDTPNTYTNEGGKFVRVNDTEDALEFTDQTIEVVVGEDAPEGWVINDMTDVDATPTDGQCLMFNNTTSQWEAGDCASDDPGVAAGTNREIQFNSNGMLGADTNLVFTSAGLLGIGTDNPGSKVEIVGNSASNRVTVSVSNEHASSKSSALYLSTANGTTGGWMFGTDYHNLNEDNWFIWGGGSGAVRMFMNDAGNLALGSDQPQTRMDVRGTLRVGYAGESCDANRLGAIRYQSNAFHVCKNGSAWEPMVTGSAAVTFTSLTDTPNSYAGEAGRYVRVNSGANALEFSNLVANSVTGLAEPTGILLNDLGDVDADSPNTNDVLKWDGTNWVAGAASASVSVAGANRQIQFNDNGDLGASANLVFTSAGQMAIGAGSAHASSILDLTSTTQGMLPPRMTTTQRNAIASPAAGLQIYNTTSSQLEYYNGSAWVGYTGLGRAYQQATSGVSTTSTTWVDMPNMSGTFESNGFPALFVVTLPTYNSTTNAVGNFRLLIDGVQETTATMQYLGTANVMSASMVLQKVLTPGTHTYNVQWRTDFGTLIASWGGAARVVSISEIGVGGGSGGGSGISELTGDVLASGTGSVAATIGNNVIDFDNMADNMTLDASTDIAITGSNSFSITNSGSGVSLRVNDDIGDTTPFLIDAAGRVAIGNTLPQAKLDVTGTIKLGYTAEACDASHLGSIRYQSNNFHVCKNGSAWEAMATGTVSAAGGNREIQFNSAGSFAASADFVLTEEGGISLSRNNARTTAGYDIGYDSYMVINPSSPQPLGSGYTTGSETSGFSSYLEVPSASSNRINRMRGADFGIQNEGTGEVVSMIGSNTYVGAVGAANVTDLIGSVGRVHAEQGTIQNMVGVLSRSDIYSAPNVVSMKGVNVQVNRHVGAGSLTNRYGIYLETPIGTATNDWGIYQQGTTRNYFGGALGLGAEASHTKLNVAGTVKMGYGGEACDANRLGSIRYLSNNFHICKNGSSWETLGGAAAGSATQVQFNSGGNFAADAGFTFNAATDVLSIGGGVQYGLITGASEPISVASGAMTVSTNNTILGRHTAGSGAVEEITLGTGLTLSGSVLNVTGGGGGTPGGANTQVQFNSSGSFAGNSGFTYNASTSVITVDGGVQLGLIAGADEPASYDTGSDTLAGLSCANGDIPKFDGTDWVCAADGGGGGTPGGADTEIQFNSSGAFDGSSALTFNAADAILSVDGGVLIGGTTGADAPLSGAGGADTLAGLSCAAGEVAEFDGSDWVCGSGGGGTPGGADTEIQFNSSGAFDGSSALTFNVADAMLNVDGGVTIGGTTGIGAPLAGGSDTLAGLSCAAGEVAEFDGSDWVCGSGGGGTPGGADMQVQFNSSGNFAGDTGLLFNASTDVLTITGGARLGAITGAAAPTVGGGGGGGASDFIDLGDVPSDYTGHGGKYLRVTSGADGIEFADDIIDQLAGDEPVGMGIDNLSDVVITTPSNGQVLQFNGTNWVNAAGGGGASGTAGYIQLSNGSGAFTNSGTTAGQQFFWDNSTKRLGIGTATPATNLDVVGNIQYTGTLTDVSDMRLKTDIHPLRIRGSMLAKLTSIETYSYTMKADETGRVEFGVMAQEIQKTFPELVNVANDNMQTMSVNYIGLIAPMIEATKELNAENKALRAENEALKAEVAAVQAEREEIHASLNALAEDVRGLKAHTGYGIGKAQMSLWIIIGAAGSGLLFMLLSGMIRNRRKAG